MKLRRLWPLLTLAIGAGLIAAIFVQRVWLMDWLHLRNYDVPATISQLASDTSMTSYAQRLFYVNRPSLEDKAAFNRHCADHIEHSAVLGCYHGNRQGIYVYDVTDERLHGVEEVTAAHEMLHQAYDRLSTKEKNRLKKLLQDFNDTQLKDASIKEKLGLYRNAEATDITNEMHSIFGTEIAELPTELEAYYKQYFADRRKVVQLSQQYRAAFDTLQDQIARYDQRLETIGRDIETGKTALLDELKAIQAKERQLQSSSQDSVDVYRREIAAYNRQIDDYNARVQALRTLVDEYNKIVTQRNEIAFAERQLQEALDSRPTK